MDDSVHTEPVGPAPAPQPSDVPARGTVIGHFMVLEPLGTGGMGVVLSAYDHRLDRKVALKLLRPGAAATQHQLVAEAQAMARLSHANVVTVYEVGVLDGRVFVAMELVPGTTLGAWLAARPRPRRAILELCVAAGRGLAAAHAAGLVHRDFNPTTCSSATTGGPG
jgi:serine/threonine protein kinase